MDIDTTEVTGLILAGGQASRMGGVDKGLEALRGQPLVAHVLARLRPQVGDVIVSANRNLPRYAAFGLQVCADAPHGHRGADAPIDYQGPLAGLASGLAHCRTRWLVSVPCDVPDLPSTLVERLAAGLCEAGADVAMAAAPDAAGVLRQQPVFALVRASLLGNLRGFLAQGGRKVGTWLQQQRCTIVAFEDGAAFRGANTRDELRSLS